jgi:glycosyltransferase involved in cell wall biosynthesis
LLSLETKNTQSLAIVVPAYNEAHGIGGVLDELEALSQQMENQGWAVEVIIVDDGSKDDTANTARQHTFATVLEHHHNRGYGAALKTGIRHSNSQWVCITDADGTYPNERIPDLIEHATDTYADMVVGVRTGENVAIPLVRRPAKWFIRQMAIFVAGEHIPDINSGLRLFQRDTAFRFFDILPDGFSFTTTITLGMLVNGYLVKYVPIDYHARVGKSKIRPIQDTLNFLQLVFRIALLFRPLKIFIPLSSILFLLALVWALFSKLVIGQLADVSTLVIVMAAVQIIVVGMLAELITQRLPNSYRE